MIGYVGPKYVYGVKGNQYSDSSGKPTNGATTGTHLHLGIRIDEKYQNPLNFFWFVQLFKLNVFLIDFIFSIYYNIYFMQILWYYVNTVKIHWIN